MNTDIYLLVISCLIFSLRVCCKGETILWFERRRYHLLMAYTNNSMRCKRKTYVANWLSPEITSKNLNPFKKEFHTMRDDVNITTCSTFYQYLGFEKESSGVRSQNGRCCRSPRYPVAPTTFHIPLVCLTSSSPILGVYHSLDCMQRNKSASLC